MKKTVILLLLFTSISGTLAVVAFILRSLSGQGIQGSVGLLSGLNPSFVLVVWIPFSQNDQLLLWVELLGGIVSIATGILGCIAQFLSAKADKSTSITSQEVAKVMKKSYQDNFSDKITNAFSSPDMGSSMISLRKWKEDNVANNLDFSEEYAKLFHKNDPKGIQLFHDRRRVSYQFYEIYKWFRDGKVSKKFVKKETHFDWVSFLLEVVKPLDEKTPPGWNKEMYEFYWGLHPKELLSWWEKNWK